MLQEEVKFKLIEICMELSFYLAFDFVTVLDFAFAELGASAFWLKFFTNAGIPKDEAAMYAVTFTKHRITQSMLPELSKEYLSDLGIKLMGDVIAILKHARSFYSEVCILYDTK